MRIKYNVGESKGVADILKKLFDPEYKEEMIETWKAFQEESDNEVEIIKSLPV
jgi:hypothetical protein